MYAINTIEYLTTSWDWTNAGRETNTTNCEIINKTTEFNLSNATGLILKLILTPPEF